MEAPPVPTAQPEEPKRDILTLALEFLDSRRFLFFGAALGLEVLLLFGAMFVPIGPAQQQLLNNTAGTIANSTSHAGFFGTIGVIFQNNLKIALVEMIPILGLLAFVESIFLTGQVIEVIGAGRNIPGPYLGGSLFLFPFTVVELSCYAIAVSSGTLLLLSAARHRLGDESRVFVLQVPIVAGLLLLAATMETITDFAPLIGLALWVPGLIAVFYARRAVGRARARWSTGT